MPFYDVSFIKSSIKLSKINDNSCKRNMALLWEYEVEGCLPQELGEIITDRINIFSVALGHDEPRLTSYS